MLKNIHISTINCGIKYKNRDDLLLIKFENLANVAGVFTSSSMPASPVVWCKKNINGQKARALIVNAGNANAFTGKLGEATVLQTAPAQTQHRHQSKTSAWLPFASETWKQVCYGFP